MNFTCLARTMTPQVCFSPYFSMLSECSTGHGNLEPRASASSAPALWAQALQRWALSAPCSHLGSLSRLGSSDPALRFIKQPLEESFP